MVLSAALSTIFMAKALHGLVKMISRTYDLAERYKIKTLMAEVKGKFENVSVNEDNVVEVGGAALELIKLNDLSNALFYNCVKFLQTRLTKTEDFVKFANKYCDGDSKHCKAALKLVASFSDEIESDSESPLKKASIISLAGEEQTQVTAEDAQVKQELSSPPHTQIETHLVICKEEQIQDSDPDGERKGYVVIHGVEKRDSDYWNKKSKKQAKFEQKLPVVQLKHCYVCEVLF